MASALDKIEQLNKASDYLNGAKKIYDETKRLKLATKSNVKDPADLEKIIGLNTKTYEKLAKYFDKTHAHLTATIAAGYPAVEDHSRKTLKELQALKKKGAPPKDVEKKFKTYSSLINRTNTRLLERINYMELVMSKSELNAKNFGEMDALINKTDHALDVMMRAFPEQVGEAAALKKLEIHTGRILNRAGNIAKLYDKLRDMSLRHKLDVSKIQKSMQKEVNDANKVKLKAIAKDAESFFKSLGF